MSKEKSVLFQPIQIGKHQVKGRVFKTATSETRATPDGFVSEELLEFYDPIARAGTPLVVTGNLYTTEQGKSTFRMCGADHENKIPGLTQWANLIHQHGGLIYGQINHCGRQVFAKAMGLDSAVSASNVREKVMGTKPRPMTTAQVRETIQDYANSAKICQKAGFDGVQIHAGHGYLISQFLTPYTNRRQDQYGGTFFKRMRLLLEIYWAIRERCGEDFSIIMKINGSDNLPGRQGLSSRDLLEVTRILAEEGLEAVEITVGHYESGFPMIRGKFGPYFKGLVEEGLWDNLDPVRKYGVKAFRPIIAAGFDLMWPPKEGFNLENAILFKKHLPIPVACVGGFVTGQSMEKAIESGACDAISCARSMIADPLLYQHLKTGEQGPKCDFCNACIARAGRMPAECYNPEIKKEKDLMLAA